MDPDALSLSSRALVRSTVAEPEPPESANETITTSAGDTANDSVYDRIHALRLGKPQTSTSTATSTTTASTAAEAVKVVNDPSDDEEVGAPIVPATTAYKVFVPLLEPKGPTTETATPPKEAAFAKEPPVEHDEPTETAHTGTDWNDNDNNNEGRNTGRDVENAGSMLSLGDNYGESIVNPGTFINTDTFIQSNDDTRKPDEEKEDDEDDAPKTFFGIVRGCARDHHLKHGVLYVANIVYLIVWWANLGGSGSDCAEGLTQDIYGSVYYQECPLPTYCFEGWTYDAEFRLYYNSCGSTGNFFNDRPWLSFFLWAILYGLFLAEFFYSSTSKYLRNINHTEDIMDMMNRLYQTAPTITIKIDCYHYESRPLTETDPNAAWYVTTMYCVVIWLLHCCGSSAENKTKRMAVVSHTERETVVIRSWRDDSIPLDKSAIHKYLVTKVKLHKNFTGDDHLEAQCNAMILRNQHRDKFYTFNVWFDLADWKDRAMTLVDLDRQPRLLSFAWGVAAHVLLFPALFYRIYMSSITGKTETTIHKFIQTEYTQ